MLEIIIFSVAVLAIFVWVLFALELADYIKNKKEKNKRKGNQEIISLILNTTFTIAVIVFFMAIYFFLKVKGLISI